MTNAEKLILVIIGVSAVLVPLLLILLNSFLSSGAKP